MNAGDNGPTVENDIRSDWTPPVVKRLNTDDAENAVGGSGDDVINYS